MVSEYRIIVDGITVEGPEAKRITDEVWRGVDDSGRPRRRFSWAMLIGFVVLPGVIVGVVNGVVGLIRPGIPTWVFVAIAVPLGLATSIAWVNLFWYRHKRQLRAAMRRHGFELCNECGYWLKGLPDDADRCPECGSALQRAAPPITC